jgi:uncharacterized repeat protein (TIGR01451 family)
MSLSSTDADWFIYEDDLDPAWSEWSWGVVANYSSTVPTYGGSPRAIAITYTSGWVGFSLRVWPPVQPTTYPTLTFRLHGGSGDDKPIRVFFQTENDGGDTGMFYLTATAGVWTPITIPLSAITQVVRINFQSYTNTAPLTIYLDEIRLLSVPQPPASGYTATIQIEASTALTSFSPFMLGSNLPAWLEAWRLNDPTFRARTKASGLRLLRLPGGSWSNTYGWLSCELGADQPGVEPCAEDWESWAAKPSNFLAFLKATNTEGLWVVNPNSTAQEAAALVAFFNGYITDTRPISTDIRGTSWYTVGHWARLRASKGYTDPVPIKFWEFGNEVYASKPSHATPSSQGLCQSGGATWEETWTCDGTEYVHGAISGTQTFEGYLAFRQAMQYVDPQVQLIAAGFEYPGAPSDTQAQWQTYAGWGSRLISAAGSSLDLYGIHPYPYLRLPRAMRHVLDAPQWAWPYIANKLQQAFTIYGGGHQPPIAVTEFNLVALQEMDTDQWMTRAVNMLFLADAIGKAAQSGVEMFLQWDLANLRKDNDPNNTEYGLMHPDNNFYRAPQYYVYPLWSRFGTHMLAATNTAHEGTQLSVYAGRVNSDVISLLAINKAGAPVTANIVVNNFPPLSGGFVYEVRAASLASQSVFYNGSHNPSDDLTSAPPQPFSISGSAFSRILPPYSISLIHLFASSLSTVTLVANPITLPAGDSSVLTATVTDQFGNLVADGTVVSFTTSLGNVSPVTATTIGGAATATLSSTISGVATVTATVGSLSATALVTFTPGAPFTLTLTAVPSTLPAGHSSTLTATATDQFGNPVANGTPISFTTSLGTLSSGTAATSGGNASVTLSSTTAGTAAVTATVGSLNATALVTFTLGAPFTLTLTAVPSTLPAGHSSALTATATDQFGNPVANGTPISFTTSLGTLSSGTAATNGGSASVTLSSTIAGVATVTAAVGSLSATALVTFTPGAPFTLTLTAVPSTLPAGHSSALTATATDQFGNPVANGTPISFTTSLGTLSSGTAATSGGSASVTLSSTISGVATVTAAVGSLSATALVTFTPGAPFTLTLTAVPSTLPAGHSSALTATATDQFGNPVANGTPISFTTSLGTLSSGTAATNGGSASVTLSSTISGVATVTAAVGSLSATALVTFTPGAPFTFTLTAIPSTLPAGHSSALTATATDQFGNPVANGTPISFTTSLGTLSSGTAATSGGSASVTLSSTIAGVATVTAAVGSLSATALVTFTPGAPFTFTFTLTPAVIVANGISQSVGTATVVDQYGNPVSGVSVNFLAAIGPFSPTSSATNASGQVTAALTSLMPAAEYVSATVSGVGVRSALVTYVNPPASSAPLTATLRAVTHVLGVVRKGDLITYTVTITNNGPGQVNNVSIIAPIPSGTTYVAGSANGCYIGGSTATWIGNLPSNASHTLSYVVQVQILEGQVVKQPTVLVDGADTGIALSSTVNVVAYKAYLPTVRRAP